MQTNFNDVSIDGRLDRMKELLQVFLCYAGQIKLILEMREVIEDS